QFLYGCFRQLPLKALRLFYSSVRFNFTIYHISKNKAYLYDAKKYRTEILRDFSSSASKESFSVEGASDPEDETTFNVDNPNDPKNKKLKQWFLSDEYQKFDINFPNILGWANFIYKYDKSTSKSDMFNMLKTPQGTVISDYINPWRGHEDDFANIMDALNDPEHRRDLGAFYTPRPYAEKAADLVRIAIRDVPDGSDYVIIDRCAGTGMLEEALTEEELTHVVINTYEIKEWVVLYNKFVNKVRGIIPPMLDVQKQLNESTKEQDNNLVSGADALNKAFLTVEMETSGKHTTLQEMIDDKELVIIGFENPPYRDSTGGNSNKKSGNKSDIYDEFIKNGTTQATHRDYINLFVWSFEQYFMRGIHDKYVVFGPLKYWKSAHVINKKFVDGFAANRGNFKATKSTISVILWANEEDDNVNMIQLPAYEIVNKSGDKFPTGKSVNAIDIPDNVHLEKVADITARKVFKTFKNDSINDEDDEFTDQFVNRDGFLSEKEVKKRARYNKNIVGYLRATSFNLDGNSVSLTRTITDDALEQSYGFYLREHNYLSKLPLFVAKLYRPTEWYKKDVYFTTSDGGLDFEKDKKFIFQCALWTGLTQNNHSVSFVDSNDIKYQNELCLDKGTILRNYVDKNDSLMSDEEHYLLSEYDNLMRLVKQTEEYSPKYKYGTYQIDKQINTFYTDNNNNKKIFNNPKVNTNLKRLKEDIADYYDDTLLSNLFKYQLLK
ncbi:hypothetical protein, partial [Leuconostoc suionicum]|uniref:hypothetical protein n=1 Tax=Leuconostoc suionicum TaxID=1511761 RepID=UPI0021A29E09